ncbi:MAG: GGDEF domain-containing protein [Acidobacteria bacterium]|nr:MAG: GGDEF domain-containing protein [Acidobacteriota bacterium]REK03182.1 MAG: GGDEF domain-containing protein [Acidobacteriota bacterium]
MRDTARIPDLVRWLERLASLYELQPMACRLLVGVRDSFGADFAALALDSADSSPRRTLRAYCPSHELAQSETPPHDSEVLLGEALAGGFWGRQEDRLTVASIAEKRLRLCRDGTLLLRLEVSGGNGFLLVGPRPDREPHSPHDRDLLELVGLHLAVLIDRVRLRDEADHDPVTGTLSRNAIFANLRTVLQSASIDDQPVTIGIIELDRLDEIHRTIGHPAGEKLTRAVTEALTGMLRPGDWLGRYGGEEFLVILPQTRLKEASTLLGAIREEVRGMQVDVGTSELASTTLSIGLLALEYGGTTAMARSRIEDLVAVADFALLQAKQKGGDTIHKWSWRHAQPLGPCA